MSDSESDEKRSEKKETFAGINDKTVRSSKEIKARQLKNLWMTDKAAEKIKLLLSYYARSNATPEGQGHQSSLYATIPHQDPAMMKKNFRNYLDGYGMQMSAPGYVPDPQREAAAATFAGDGDIKNTEIYKIYQEIVEAEKQNPLDAPELLLEHASLLLAESLNEVKAAGQLYYADDVYLARQPKENASQTKDDGDALHDMIFRESPDENAPAVSPPDISELFNMSGLDGSGHPDIQPPYREVEFNPPRIELKSADNKNENDPAKTMLDYTGCNDVHSPYADGFFNAARWPEAAPDSVEREHIRQELEEAHSVNITIAKPKLQ